MNDHQNIEKNTGLVIKKPLHEVILRYIKEYHRETSERAHSDVKDGLKPVLRRIITIMWEEKLTYFRKVAFVSGNTMGKLHPHGDASINDVITSSMQEFTMNYPYFDAQGNKGSQDGDPAAASRYLETKLSKFTQDVITDNIKRYALETVPNYDMTRDEFKYLPTKVPLLLLQVCYGIGEGFMMSTPSYNLQDVVQSVIKFIQNKDIPLTELVKDIYPDYPTGGIIINKTEIEKYLRLEADEIETALQEGKTFTLKIKARCILNTEKSTIEIVDLPYGVFFQRIQEQILDEVQNRGNIILSGIINFGNHRNKNDQLIFEIMCKKDANLLEILNELYRKTQLYKSSPISSIYYDDGSIKRLSFKDVIQYWYDTQVRIKRRTYNFEYSDLQNQIHVWYGLIKIYDKRNDVIEIIKGSEDKQNAIQKLVSQLDLSQVQARGIVEMQLSSLARTSKVKLENDIQKGLDRLKELEYAMNTIDQILIQEAREIGEKYKRDRRTTVIDESLGNKTAITISSGAVLYSETSFGVFNAQGLSNSKILLNSLKPSKINGKMVKEIKSFHRLNKNITGIIIFTSDGYAKRVKIQDIPLVNTWIVSDSVITTIVPIYENSEDGTIIVITEDMNIRKIKIEDISTRVTVGKVIASHYSLYDDERILVYNQEGKYLYIEGDEIPLLNRNAGGNRIEFNLGDILSIYPIGEAEESLILAYTHNEETFIGVMDIAELKSSHRTNKPKSFIDNKKFSFYSASPISFDDKEDSQIICLGKQSSNIIKTKLLKNNMAPRKISIKAIGFIQI